jgi:hypothetical protein
VPKSAAQELVHTLLLEDELRKECAEKDFECKEREKYLDEQWEQIRQLEQQLKLAFIDTEDKIQVKLYKIILLYMCTFIQRKQLFNIIFFAKGFDQKR